MISRSNKIISASGRTVISAVLAFAVESVSAGEKLSTVVPEPGQPISVAPADPLPCNNGYFTLFFDNDKFGGTDRNYTNGVRISYITEGKPIIKIPFIQKELGRFCGGLDSSPWVNRTVVFKNPNEVEYSYGIALTQLIYTPKTHETLTAPKGEHPYAGWLGLGFSLHARDAQTLHSVEFTVGVVGPHSYAQETQDYIHRLRGIDRLQGWDSQIPNEVTLNVALNQRRRWKNLDNVQLPYGLELDGFNETGLALGNFLTAAHIGGMVRVGWNLPVEFSDPRLTTSAHTQKLYSGQSVNRKAWSFYALAGLRGSGILHEITLDGPVFRSFDTGVDRVPWVGEVYAGFGLRRNGWEIGYVHTYRTKRFKTQDRAQLFGSFAIRTHF